MFIFLNVEMTITTCKKGTTICGRMISWRRLPSGALKMTMLKKAMKLIDWRGNLMNEYSIHNCHSKTSRFIWKFYFFVFFLDKLPNHPEEVQRVQVEALPNDVANKKVNRLTWPDLTSDLYWFLSTHNYLHFVLFLVWSGLINCKKIFN